jgi:hypothetical protein
VPLLFSYGTLQQTNVQAIMKIDDASVVEASGKTRHPIVRFTGNAVDSVPGTVFEISDSELAMADEYEVKAYTRVSAQSASGRDAWLYVDARR